MDADFIKDEMVPKSIPRSSLFRDDTLQRLSAKLDPCDVVSLLYLMSDSDDKNDSNFNKTKLDERKKINVNEIYVKLSAMEERKSAETVDFPNICSQHIPNWKSKIIEALVEVQLFDALLIVFGVNKLDAMYNVSVNDRVLNPNKIIIFKICDGLDEVRKAAFLGRMRQVLREGEFSNMPPMDFAYLEMFFMYWQLIGKISPSGKGFDLILEGLQVTGSERLLELFLPPGKLTVDDYTLKEYPIFNDDQVGLCVIMNQFQFEDPHNNRSGSGLDEESLKSVMESLNFNVVTRHNLLANEMVGVMKETINTHFKKSHSMIFVTIMSHGQDGYVMGKEGMYLSTQDIVKALDCQRLIRVPKVLVICACRGNDGFTRAKVTYEADGPEDKSMTLRSDIMDIITCYSTIPGFISLRNREKGTLFMQVLCDVLKTRADLEICELFTTVNKALMNPKEFKSYNPYQLAHPCEFNSRLLKKLYLKKRSSSLP